MRVLLTTDTVGGVWTFTCELATELLDRGHSVALVSFGGVAAESQQLWCASMLRAFGNAFRYVCSELPLEWMQRNEKAYAGAEKLLLRIVEECKTEVFHSSQFCFGRLPVALPKLVTAHSDVLSWGRACRPLGLGLSSWLNRYRRLVTNGITGADAVVAPTQWMLGALQEEFNLHSPGHVIYNGRDLHVPAGVIRKLQVVSVGRLWDEGKNLALLAKINVGVPVVVAGATQCQEVGVLEHPIGLTALGPLAEHDLLRLFSESSVYVVTSLYEPFGLAPLEAALCGCAVVAMDLASLHEIWGDAAIYFSSEEEMAAVLQALCNDPALLHAAQERARQHALQFSRGRMTQNYLALYQELIHSRIPASSREMTYAN